MDFQNDLAGVFQKLTVVDLVLAKNYAYDLGDF